MTTETKGAQENSPHRNMCEGISAVFRVGDSGTVDIGDTTDVDLPVLRRAVAACPTGALRLVDETSTAP